MNLDLAATINVAIVLAGLAAAAVWLRSALMKQRHEELAQLADIRGETIKDQNHKIEALEGQVKELKEGQVRLEAQIAGIQAIKATEIADEVVHKIAPLISLVAAQADSHKNP